MAKASLDLRPHRRVQQAIKQLTIGQAATEVLRYAGNDVGVAFDEFVRKQLPPNVVPGRQAHLWTKKQMAWWWATMHAKAQGLSDALPGWTAEYRRIDGVKTLVISGSYKRTGLMVRSLHHAVTAGPRGVDVQYGTAVKYARRVISKEHQAEYHRGNWPVLEDLLFQYAPEARRVFENTLTAEIQRRLN